MIRIARSIWSIVAESKISVIRFRRVSTRFPAELHYLCVQWASLSSSRTIESGTHERVFEIARVPWITRESSSSLDPGQKPGVAQIPWSFSPPPGGHFTRERDAGSASARLAIVQSFAEVKPGSNIERRRLRRR